ncbi:TPA: hypothetical protein ACLBFU_001437 [Neisseria meningitidis]
MATNKKPRKKYRPHRLLLSGYGDRAVEFAAKAASNEPLGAANIAAITRPMVRFIVKLKAGEAEHTDFYSSCAAHYLYAGLLAVLKKTPIKADAETELKARLEFDILYEIAADKTPDLLGGMKMRAESRGRWLATGDELKHLDDTLENFRAVLGIASWQHYIQAFKETEPVLNAEIHKQNRIFYAKQKEAA